MKITDRILRAWKGRGLFTGFIWGAFAHGKTSYLLHATFELLKDIYNKKDVDTWYMALDYLFFHPVEALVFVETYHSKHNTRVPILGMDDVGQHLPRARWWRQDVVEFREWCTVARDDCSCILFTAPTQLSLPGGIVDSCVWRIRVERHPDKKGWSLAYGYEVSVTPYFQRNISGPKFVDVFPTHYPDYVYDMYTEMRKRAVAPLRRHLISLMGVDKAIKTMKDTGMTQDAIAKVVGKSAPTVSRKLHKN